MAERDRHGRILKHGGDGHPSSVDMLMSVIDHLDLGAIMQHLRVEEEKEETGTQLVQVDNSEVEDLTTAESIRTIQVRSGINTFYGNDK